MTDAEIVAELFGSPCNYSPIDEEMCLNGDCEHICGTPEQTDAKCWQRYFDLKRRGALHSDPEPKYLINVHYKDTKNMEDEQEEDIITIHLGKVLTQEQYDEVVASVTAFMNKRWPEFTSNRFSN